MSFPIFFFRLFVFVLVLIYFFVQLYNPFHVYTTRVTKLLEVSFVRIKRIIQIRDFNLFE